MLRLRNVAALQRSLNTKAFYPNNERLEKEEPPLNANLEANAGPRVPSLTESVRKLRSLPNQKTVDGCSNLRDIHQIMTFYRESRDSPDRTEKVIASDIINAILTATRSRDQVFRRCFVKDRVVMLQAQNKVLAEYLDEIVTDIENGQTCLSAYAITYLLTAFSRTGQSHRIVGLWEQLKHIGEKIPDLGEHLKRPTVVSATLNQADPSTMSLEFVERLYELTVKESGPSILLDEALIRAYLRADLSERVAEKYASLLQEYPINENDMIFDRIHSTVITETNDIKIATAFYEMAIGEDSHIKRVHPGAVCNFIKLNYANNKNWDQSAQIFLQAAAYYAQRHPSQPTQEIGNMMNAIWHIFSTTYHEDTQEARNDFMALLDQFAKVYPGDHIFFNTGLSQLNKNWLDSDFPQVVVARALENLPQLGADSCRVILNSRPNLDTMSRVWTHRTSLESEPLVYDYIALVQSANDKSKAKFVLAPLVTAIQSLQPRAVRQLRDHCVRNDFVKEAILDSQNDILLEMLT